MADINHRQHVLVVEPSEGVRRRLSESLAGGGFAPVEIADSAGAPAAFERLLPDVCFFGVRAGNDRDHDIAAIKAIVRRHPDALIIAVLDDASAPGVAELARVGARGVLLGRALDGVAPTAARWVLAGGAVVGPRLARCLFDFMRQNGAGNANTSVSGEPALTRKERDVLARIARGYRNKEIADEFGITEGTVKCHLHQIYRKLGVRDRTAAAVHALRPPERVAVPPTLRMIASQRGVDKRVRNNSG